MFDSTDSPAETRRRMALILGDLHASFQDMSDLDLAFAYADYLDYELGSDSLFIQEMQRRGLDFADLEQELINYYDTESL